MFNSLPSLTSLIIGSGVTSVGSYAFEFCSRLTALFFSGNYPTAAFSLFNGVTNATVYYLPGTTGWGPTFGGRPTALWQPQIQTRDASFGVRSNRLGFNIGWAGGMTVVVDACTNLCNPFWVPVQTNVLSSDTVYFSDPQRNNHPSRSYCVLSMQ